MYNGNIKCLDVSVNVRVIEINTNSSYKQKNKMEQKEQRTLFKKGKRADTIFTIRYKIIIIIKNFIVHSTRSGDSFH